MRTPRWSHPGSWPKFLALTAGALLLSAAACDCGGEVGADGGGLPRDAGADPAADAGPRGDGGALVDGGSGQPPATLEQMATELCFSYARGLLNLERHLALEALPARCSNDDEAPDVSATEALPIGSCGVQDPRRDLFLRALSGGRVAISLEAFRACVDKGRAVRAAGATLGDLPARAAGLQALPSDDDCAAAITPLVSEAGAGCVQAWDCVAPLACQADPLDSFSLKCLPPAAEGARCDDAPPFDDVLALRTCASGLACVLGVCTSRLAEDAACSDDGVPCAAGLTCRSSASCGVPSLETEVCADDGDCAAGLFCDGATLTCLALLPPAGDGEPCVATDECGGLCSVCRPLEGGDGGTACQDRAPAGGACATDDHCRAGLFCDAASGACAPYRALDEACGPAAPCRAGLLCTDEPPPPPPPNDAGVVVDPDPPVPGDGGPSGPFCQAPRSVGESCQRFGVWRCGEGSCVDDVCRAGTFGDPCLGDGDCQEGALCVANTCARAPRSGAPCTADGRCDDDLLCRANRCVELPAAGEACTADRRCAAGAFCPSAATTCEALRPPGLPCTADGECATGICLDTLTCGAEGASCLTTGSAFAQIVGLSLMLPLLSRLRRRRRR